MLIAFPYTEDVTTGGEEYFDEPNLLVSDRTIRQPVRPIAPYEADSQKWPTLKWVDLHNGKPVRLYWGREVQGLGQAVMRVQTFREVLHRHVTHPEAKAAGPDGSPCESDTTGELSRLRVSINGAVHIGKESQELEEVQAGLTLPNSAYVHYLNETNSWKNSLAVLRRMSREALTTVKGKLKISRVQWWRILNGRSVPRSRLRQVLNTIARNQDF